MQTKIIDSPQRVFIFLLILIILVIILISIASTVPYPVDPYSAICDDYTYIHTYIDPPSGGSMRVA